MHKLQNTNKLIRCLNYFFVINIMNFRLKINHHSFIFYKYSNIVNIDYLLFNILRWNIRRGNETSRRLFVPGIKAVAPDGLNPTG